jgi:hypothetical protein
LAQPLQEVSAKLVAGDRLYYCAGCWGTIQDIYALIADNLLKELGLS